ncbi:hypothetical protein BW723_15900 [Polaribacter reichenbachii]|uniref:Uncharacterized protein n=1 Tax=Polaribacter reichenbachii TaxID=996801 RepID=A0A1B8U545_9FLAO|nr:hypothetical protein [Polaribacter reichenbachii]APZ47683.1 hypothetical protein BW723_15900 [Polaribacter reichenbachii]AUC18323.1 hypothetical protein BTO17_06345 [Polaribacter reichenbachii]OBY66964.1 hypothetical protein LPB301_03885 [Polaribacter reichenbachii]
MTRIYRSFSEPDRENLTWEETWKQEDKGLIKNYEVGRALAIKEPELAEKAKRGELPVLGYKGGVDKALKKKEKIGALNYIAKWQALRGEDLNIDMNEEMVLICTKTKMIVTFTMDLEKLKNAN